jgi:hypothetical protein
MSASVGGWGKRVRRGSSRPGRSSGCGLPNGFGAMALNGRQLAARPPRPYSESVSFRERLLATLHAVRNVLDEPGIMVAGSQVPNLLEPGARSSLVVSQDVDLVVPIEKHEAVRQRLANVNELEPSHDEPSVWLPRHPGIIEVNFIGVDTTRPGETYVFDHAELPLLVFGNLSLLRLGDPIAVDGLVIPVPRTAGLLAEKLLTDRSGEKGDRDLLVVMGLLLVAQPADIDELELIYRALPPEQRYTVRSNLSVLSLLEARAEMPDPVPHRATLAGLMARLERVGSS